MFFIGKSSTPWKKNQLLLGYYCFFPQEKHQTDGIDGILGCPLFYGTTFFLMLRCRYPENNSFIFLQGMGDISRLTLISPLCYITTIVNGKTMENHHFEWENALFSMAMFNSYVKLHTYLTFWVSIRPCDALHCHKLCFVNPSNYRSIHHKP